MNPGEKKQIEAEIERARDGVGDRIDELDAQLRRKLDFDAMAREHAPQIVAGGAVVGFLVGFGFPKILKRAIQIGVPLALIAYKVKTSRDGDESEGFAEV
ncbi:MAG TPA: hypothetical protein VHU41_09110 [Thermoanaerobaculia bacterium]|jgi:hypothetical protein|nr:hypothetical protein [Thermoanaerobaculia bacterium]